ncbi:MAG: alpha/beta hydrolase [Gammaproteobacteria bacterium]|nr:alpha/beta hydrolase [Gammaproteobacteria bacterium]
MKEQPVVWLELSQSELDASYDQSVYAPNMTEVLGRLSKKSRETRDNLSEPLRCQYGDKAIEAMDIYACGQARKPILVFVHGGSWQVGSAEDNAFAAQMAVNAGIHFVVPDFSPVDDFNGDLEGMIAQLQQAVVWLYQHAEEFGGDPEQLFLCGFSSGAHLAGVLLTRDWIDLGLPKEIFKGALLCSGMYDLFPVSLSFRKEFLSLNADSITRLSPQANTDKISMPLLVAYGTNESPEFQRQGKDFIEALESADNSVQTLIGMGLNHFEIIETLADPEGLLGQPLLSLIQQSSA